MPQQSHVKIWLHSSRVKAGLRIQEFHKYKPTEVTLGIMLAKCSAGVPCMGRMITDSTGYLGKLNHDALQLKGQRAHDLYLVYRDVIRGHVGFSGAGDFIRRFKFRAQKLGTPF